MDFTHWQLHPNVPQIVGGCAGGPSHVGGEVRRTLVIVADHHRLRSQRIGFGYHRIGFGYHGIEVADFVVGDVGIELKGDVGRIYGGNASVVLDEVQAIIDSDPSQEIFECTSKPVHISLKPCESGCHLLRLLGTFSQVGNLGLKVSKPFVDI